MVSLEASRGQISNLEKKQKKFDAQLAEMSGLAEKNASDRDSAESRARQAETKSLSLSRELEELQDKLDETERLRKQLQVCGCVRPFTMFLNNNNLSGHNGPYPLSELA